MDRRDFIRSGLTAGGLAAVGVRPLAAQLPSASPRAETRRFKLDYAPHFGMFRHHAGEDLVSQLRFMADEGFTALEDNEMRTRPAAVQERIGRELTRLGMRMGVFVAHTIHWHEPTLTTGRAAVRDAFLAEIRASVDVAGRVNATWVTVVPGHLDPRLDRSYQTANLVETLRRAADILEPHGLVMVLEPLNTRRDHPGMFLTHIGQAYQICRAVDSPSCKILYDVYHQQITEGNLVPNMDAAWSEVAYFQVGDHPGRAEPTTGEINYRNIFRPIDARGYTGIIGMEHGNSMPGRAGERAVIDAYLAVDPS